MNSQCTCEDILNDCYKLHKIWNFALNYGQKFHDFSGQYDFIGYKTFE